MPEIDTFFERMLSEKASDLHLEQGQPPKMRVHGHLHPVEGEAVLTEDRLTMLLSEIPSPERWAAYEKCGDLDFACELPEKARFRANYYRHQAGIGAVFRMIPSKVLTLAQLEMPDSLKKFADLRSGLVLVTGPTGSGKSTTLAAIIDHINETLSRKIITIEEPVEFMHTNRKSTIFHREVGLDTASFAAGLRGAIKSDAEIILVGEMRDLETIRLALTAAQMGILVFGTLHTNSAPKTVDRIIDAFPANEKNQVRTVLANVLKGVISQQLLKGIEGSRRYAAWEIMFQTMALSAIIAEGETVKMISEIQMHAADGMVLMDDRLAELVMGGMVRKEDAFMKARDKQAFQQRVAGY